MPGLASPHQQYHEAVAKLNTLLWDLDAPLNNLYPAWQQVVTCRKMLHPGTPPQQPQAARIPAGFRQAGTQQAVNTKVAKPVATPSQGLSEYVEFNNALQQTLGRGLTKGDIIFHVADVQVNGVQQVQAHLSLPNYDGGVQYCGNPAGTSKDAKREAVIVALHAFKETYGPHVGKAGKLNQSAKKRKVETPAQGVKEKVDESVHVDRELWKNKLQNSVFLLLGRDLKKGEISYGTSGDAASGFMAEVKIPVHGGTAYQSILCATGAEAMSDCARRAAEALHLEVEPLEQAQAAQKWEKASKKQNRPGQDATAAHPYV